MNRALSLQTLASTLMLGRLAFFKPRIFSTIVYVRRQRLSYLWLPALADLAAMVLRLEAQKVPGSLVEAGCAQGGSSLVIASAKNSQRPFWMYDTFEMIPPPSDNDGKEEHERYQQIVSGQAQGPGQGMYYGYRQDLIAFIEGHFKSRGLAPAQNEIHMVKGLFDDTLKPVGPVAFAHLDCDWYDSVMTCLERIAPRLSIGGVMVIDDYLHWSGCKKAIDEYFADKKGEFEFYFQSRLHIRRIKGR